MTEKASFLKLNCCACFLSLAIMVLCIAAVIVDWYKYSIVFQAVEVSNSAGGTNPTFNVNTTKVFYTVQGLTTSINVPNGEMSNKFKEYSDMDSVHSIFRLVFGFTMVALILSGFLLVLFVLYFAEAIRNKVLFALGMTVLRLFLVVVAAIVLISVLIAFLAFLGITNAFDDDIPNCQRGYCRRFQDSIKQEHGTVTADDASGKSRTYLETSTEEWGPTSAWYLVLTCTPLAIALLICIIVNKFPIPVDSVGTGEAL